MAGLKVADFAWVGVGPLSSKFLADHGATVIRVESSNRPETLRTSGPFFQGKVGLNRSHFFNNFNSNIKLRNYSIRSNININLTPTTTGIVRTYGQFDDYNGPIGGGDLNIINAMQRPDRPLRHGKNGALANRDRHERALIDEIVPDPGNFDIGDHAPIGNLGVNLDDAPWVGGAGLSLSFCKPTLADENISTLHDFGGMALGQ